MDYVKFALYVMLKVSV